jgi:hypothetical protein
MIYFLAFPFGTMLLGYAPMGTLGTRNVIDNVVAKLLTLIRPFQIEVHDIRYADADCAQNLLDKEVLSVVLGQCEVLCPL